MLITAWAWYGGPAWTDLEFTETGFVGFLSLFQ